MHYKFTGLTGLVLTLVLLTSCSHDLKSQTLTLDVGGDPTSLDPAIAEDAGSWRIINDLFLGLVDRDQHNRILPGIASSWEISDSGKTYIFHLRPNLKFSDGNPLTASDVVFSWQRLVAPQTGSPYSFLLNNLVNAESIINGKLPSTQLGVSAANPQTVVVKLVHPDSAFLTYLTTPNVFVVSQRSVTKFGKQWSTPENFVSSGAYTLSEQVKNGYIIAKKNPYYYDESTVRINYVKYLPYTNGTSGLNAFKTGELDITWKLPVEQYTAMQQEYPNQFHHSISERSDFLYLNLQNPKLQDKKLRQALTMAVDRQALVNQVLHAGQRPLYALVTPTIENGKYSGLEYTWAKESATAQLSAARTLYQQAGYSAANPLSLTLIYRNDDIHKKVAIAIASMWKQSLGINVTLETQEYKVLLQNLHHQNYEVMASGGWGADYNEVSTYSGIYICGSSNNSSGYCNPAYDALIKQAGSTVSPSQQQQLVKQALELAQNDYPVLPLFEPSRYRLVSSRVQNYDFEANYLDDVQSKWLWLKQ